MSKRTLFLIFSLFIITSVLLIMMLYKPNIQPSPIQIIPTPKEETAQTILSFGEPIIAVSSSASTLNYSLPINITTGKNKVNAVQLEMQYDPEVLINATVSPGSFFKNPEVLLDQINPKTGRITYAFGVGLAGQGVMGKGIVANIVFSTKVASDATKVAPTEQTTILFLPKTLVTAENETESVLKQTNNIQLTVGKNNSTPSAQ